MKNKKNSQEKWMDQPDEYKSSNESILDKFEDEQMTDPIPLEELKQQAQDEKNKRHTKSSSSSEKYDRRNEGL
ncbi:hypothetical protein [Jeotgalibacillus soli]|uniref:Uncharacterized protein n=1 Tax=Jeotgalibacillus soli TaxID=889306 RepID=A0A0C2R508_9BACL|nr:hypothetical protein [Jeotgalibacillus soli]KIL45345.1 hypothetical protein KP78_28890 [Jeotgalibacillus soli]